MCLQEEEAGESFPPTPHLPQLPEREVTSHVQGPRGPRSPSLCPSVAPSSQHVHRHLLPPPGVPALRAPLTVEARPRDIPALLLHAGDHCSSPPSSPGQGQVWKMHPRKEGRWSGKGGHSCVTSRGAWEQPVANPGRGRQENGRKRRTRCSLPLLPLVTMHLWLEAPGHPLGTRGTGTRGTGTRDTGTRGWVRGRQSP